MLNQVIFSVICKRNWKKLVLLRQIYGRRDFSSVPVFEFGSDETHETPL